MKHVEWLEEDTGLILRGILGCLVFVISGVMLAEGALNDLTQQAYFIQILNVKSTQSGHYTMYVFGNHFTFSSLWEMGRISSLKRTIYITIAGSTYTINTLPVIDIHAVLDMLARLAAKTQDSSVLLLRDAYHWIAVGMAKINDMLNRIVAEVM